MAQMASSRPDESAELKSRILAILDDNRVMAVATLRPDGWPQATMVGYVADDLTLYFAVARDSQKLANIVREPRISIALGREGPNRIRGLSIAALASEVMETAEIERLNQRIWARFPEEIVFAPRETASAVVRAEPKLISLIDHDKGPGEPELMEVAAGTVRRRSTSA
jgi:general stress protein 26